MTQKEVQHIICMLNQLACEDCPFQYSAKCSKGNNYCNKLASELRHFWERSKGGNKMFCYELTRVYDNHMGGKRVIIDKYSSYSTAEFMKTWYEHEDDKDLLDMRIDKVEYPDED